MKRIDKIKLTDALTRRGISQYRLAVGLAMSPSTLSGILSGRLSEPPGLLGRVAQQIDVEADAIATEVSEETRTPLFGKPRKRLTCVVTGKGRAVCGVEASAEELAELLAAEKKSAPLSDAELDMGGIDDDEADDDEAGSDDDEADEDE